MDRARGYMKKVPLLDWLPVNEMLYFSQYCSGFEFRGADRLFQAETKNGIRLCIENEP